MNLIETMSAEVEKNNFPIILLPVGSLEQHGTEAPLGCDGIIADWVCREAGERTGCPVLPSINYGNSNCHTAFPGTFSLSIETYAGLLLEIIRESERNGYRKIIILSGHGGNRTAAMEAIQNAAGSIFAEYLGYWQLPGFTAEEEKLFGKTGHHITTSEVSMVWWILNRPVPGVFKGKYPPVFEQVSGMSPDVWRKHFPDGGVGGDMHRVSVDKGRNLLEFTVNALTEKIETTGTE